MDNVAGNLAKMIMMLGRMTHPPSNTISLEQVFQKNMGVGYLGCQLGGPLSVVICYILNDTFWTNSCSPTVLLTVFADSVADGVVDGVADMTLSCLYSRLESYLPAFHPK